MKKTLILLLTAVVLFVMNIFFGSVHIDASDVVATLMGRGDSQSLSFIILQHRLPQALTALLAGSSLAVAGLMLQTLFHNPLAGPSVLGISGGASLGVAIVMLGASLMGVTLMPFSSVIAAFVGALIVTTLLLFVNSILDNKVVLLIIGLLLGYLISSAISILNAVGSTEGLHNYVVWGMGDFSSVTIGQMPLFAFVLVFFLICCLLMAKPLNALLLGDDYASNLGINLKRMRHLILFVVGGITAMTTAYCGPVAFIGLAVPHIARMLSKTDDAHNLLPTTLLCGTVVALLCNLICCIPDGMQLPLNAVTPIVGIPVILYVVVKRSF